MEETSIQKQYMYQCIYETVLLQPTGLKLDILHMQSLENNCLYIFFLCIKTQQMRWIDQNLIHLVQ